MNRPLKPSFVPRAKARASFADSLANYLAGETVQVESLACAGERFQLACIAGTFSAVKTAEKALPALRRLAKPTDGDAKADRGNVRTQWLAALGKFAKVATGKAERTDKPLPTGKVSLSAKPPAKAKAKPKAK